MNKKQLKKPNLRWKTLKNSAQQSTPRLRTPSCGLSTVVETHSHELDGSPGFASLREWYKNAYDQMFDVLENQGWKSPMPKQHHDALLVTRPVPTIVVTRSKNARPHPAHLSYTERRQAGRYHGASACTPSVPSATT